MCTSSSVFILHGQWQFMCIYRVMFSCCYQSLSRSQRAASQLPRLISVVSDGINVCVANHFCPPNSMLTCNKHRCAFSLLYLMQLLYVIICIFFKLNSSYLISDFSDLYNVLCLIIWCMYYPCFLCCWETNVKVTPVLKDVYHGNYDTFGNCFTVIILNTFS